MGTLEQPPRKHKETSEVLIMQLITEIKDVASSKKIDFETTLRVYELAEQRRKNDLYVANGDIHDEQVFGMSQVLNELRHAIADLSPNQPRSSQRQDFT
tara:strand:- start:5263 stop:5559 length:297 start_codon:yes stop_codon:yes gene_type:complete